MRRFDSCSRCFSNSYLVVRTNWNMSRRFAYLNTPPGESDLKKYRNSSNLDGIVGKLDFFLLELFDYGTVSLGPTSTSLVIVHRNDELPSDSSFQISFNYGQKVVQMMSTKTLLSEEVKQMSPQQRNCFFENERTLQFFQNYSKSNCEHECQSFAFSDRCGCVPFYLVGEIIECWINNLSISISN